MFGVRPSGESAQRVDDWLNVGPRGAHPNQLFMSCPCFGYRTLVTLLQRRQPADKVGRKREDPCFFRVDKQMLVALEGRCLVSIRAECRP